MSPSRPSPLAVFATLLWPLFIACSALVAVVWLSGFGAGTVADPDFADKVPNPELRTALALFSRALDPTWIVLGAVNLYLALVRAEGLATVRRWSGMILGAGFVVAVLSATTGVPLGPVFFPTNLGLKLGPVPFALPFLWLLVVGGARETVLRALPRLSHGGCAVLTGGCCALTSWVLDPVAWKYRAWWLWYPARLDAPGHAPWSAPVTWLVAGAGLAFAMRSASVAPRVMKRANSPMVSYLIFNVVVVLTRVVHG